MTPVPPPDATRLGHSHVFLGPDHAASEHRTWMVVWLCAAMMLAEIGGGVLSGSIALVADGLHMSTHAGALLLAALAYRFARKYADDARFAFGTGKLGDLAGFTSAIILAAIAALIGYEAISRLLNPVPIHFAQAIPIACVGLAVNLASAWLLGAEVPHHPHGHTHAPAAGAAKPESPQRFVAGDSVLTLEIFEDGVPPRFRLHAVAGPLPAATDVAIETERAGSDRQATGRQDTDRQRFTMVERDGFLESRQIIPEPHAFLARVGTGGRVHRLTFTEPDHAHAPPLAANRDNNLRAAIIHVLADAAVSVLVIAGLLAAQIGGWVWMDPLAGIIGAAVIGGWSYALIRDTGAILLDTTPDRAAAERLRRTIERDGDAVTDLHLWRLGPGHLGAILCVMTTKPRGPSYYRRRLAEMDTLSHLTIEVDHPPI